MKKTLTLVLILLLVAVSSLFVFVGCGYADDGSIYLPEAPIGSDANNGSNGIENGANNGSNGIENGANNGSNGAENGAENGVPVTPEDVKVVWNTGKAGENVTWTYYGDNTLEFTGFGAMYDNEHKYLDWTNYASFAKSITISDEITTLSPYALSGARGIAEIVLPSKLTEIAEGALVNCSRLSSVTIPSGVTSIGKNAFFSCYGLTSVNIPDSVVSIGERAFYSCPIEEVTAPASAFLHMEKSALKTVVITSGNEIESNAFSGCSSLTSVTIPEGVTSIGESAFDGCSGLKSVTIPTSVTSIGYGAFSGCSSLTSITIPDGVTSIGSSAFDGCSSLTYNEYDNAYYLGNTNNPYVVLVRAKNASITSCIVNDKTKLVYSNAFDGCSGLKSVTIPDSVVSIGERAFYSCPIEEVTAPASAILHMEKSTLKTVVITSGNEIESNAFSGCSSLTSVTIPEGVTSIGESAFDGCSGLKSVTIPTSVTSIGYGAFSGCSSLTSITIPEGVTSIGESAFDGCSSLTYNEYDSAYYLGNTNNPYVVLVKAKNASITSCIVNDKTKLICSSAFSNCSSLTSITIPDSVTEIGSSAFRDCSKLTSITIPDSVTSIGDYAFGGCPIEEATIPASAILHMEKSALKTVVITSGNEIKSNAFSGCSSLQSVTIPTSVTSIGYGAFSGCSSLTSITIPDRVTSIGEDAFYNCSSLTYNEYDNAYYLGNTNNPYVVLVRAKNASITSCIVNDKTKLVYSNAFDGCSGLKSVTIPDSVVSIGGSAFEGCSSLTYNEYDNAYYLGNTNNPYVVLVKAKNTSITSCSINEKAKVIYSRAFDGCSGLKSVTIPDSVTMIGDGAFGFCGSLQSITIPEGVTKIGRTVFYECHSLQSIIIPDSVTSIGSFALVGCHSLKSITLPKKLTLIDNAAFHDCNILEKVYYKGTESEWNNVTELGPNYSLYDATKYFYSETKPTGNGNYWHYDKDGNIVEW